MTRPTTTIKNDIAQAESDLRLLITPTLAPLEKAVAELTTKALINDSFKSDLIFANQRHIEAKQNHAKHADLNNKLIVLTRELDAALAEERAFAIREMNATTTRLHEEFDHLSRMLLKAYRACQHQARVAATVPGANTQVPLAPGLANLVPMSWRNGGMPLEDIVRTSQLPCENTADMSGTRIEREAA